MREVPEVVDSSESELFMLPEKLLVGSNDDVCNVTVFTGSCTERVDNRVVDIVLLYLGSCVGKLPDVL
jgi:hypothetical protein